MRFYNPSTPSSVLETPDMWCELSSSCLTTLVQLWALVQFNYYNTALVCSTHIKGMPQCELADRDFKGEGRFGSPLIYPSVGLMLISSVNQHSIPTLVYFPSSLNVKCSRPP